MKESLKLRCHARDAPQEVAVVMGYLLSDDLLIGGGLCYHR